MSVDSDRDSVIESEDDKEEVVRSFSNFLQHIYISYFIKIPYIYTFF